MKDIHTLPPIAWDDFRRKQSTELVTSHKEQIMLQVECPNFDRPRRPDIGRSWRVDDEQWSTSDANSIAAADVYGVEDLTMFPFRATDRVSKPRMYHHPCRPLLLAWDAWQDVSS